MMSNASSQPLFNSFARFGIALVVGVLLLTVIWSDEAGSRSYRFVNITIDAEVLSDGSLVIREQRLARFTGTYRGMWLYVDLADDMEITNVSVAGQGVPYIQHPHPEPGPPNTFFTEHTPDRFTIDWSFEATDEEKLFDIRYTVTNVVQVHQDVAELYYQFIGDQWDVGADRVVIRLQLPEGADQEDILAWGHGPLQGEVSIVDERTVTFTVDGLRAGTFVEGRVVYPTELAAQALRQTGRVALPDILAEEQALADAANRRRTLARIEWIGGILLLLAALLFAIRSYGRYGRAFNTTFDGDYFRELPGEYSPAELGVLWKNGTVAPGDLTATIMDLARRGFIRLEEYEPKRGLLGRGKKLDYRVVKVKTPPEKDQLQPYEEQLLDFLFTTVRSEGADEVTFIELDRYAKRSKRSFAAFWQQFQASVKAAAGKREFFCQQGKKPRTLQVLYGLGLGAAGVAALIYQVPIIGFFLLASGVVLLIGAAALHRRSQRGNEDYVRWKAFRRFLLHFSELDRQTVPALKLWEHYLVYAVGLGVAAKVLKQLQIVYPNLEQNGYRFGSSWYVYGMAGRQSTNFANSFQSFTADISRNVQQSISAATSQSSSGSGKGGGFSGGGGGGFGGGGGGAR